MNALNLKDLAVMSVTNPAQAAQILLAQNLRRDVLWLGLALAVVLNTLLFSLSNMMLPGPEGMPVLIQSPMVYAGFVGGGILAAVHLPLAEVFSNDPSVISLSGFLFLHVALMAPLSGVAFALDGILIGAGDHNYLAKAMAVASISATSVMLLTRIWDLGIGWLWAAVWIFMGLRSALLGSRFYGSRWQVVGV